MQQTLPLKSTVTRRAPVEPVDQAERQLQAEHHEAVESAAQAANEAATGVQAEPVVPKPRGELQVVFLGGNLGKPVTVFLVNGIKLVGRLRQFDQFTVLLENNGEQLLVFKHAISTIIPTAR